MSRYQLPPSPVPMWRRVRAEAARFYPAELVAKSKAYQRPLQRAGLIGSALGLVFVLVFISVKAAPRLVEAAGDPPWPVALMLILGVFLALDTLVGAPVAIWRFKHENKWGFNKQTPASKLADELKELLLGFVMLSVFSIAIFALVRATEAWWLVAMLVVAVLVGVLSFLSPTLLRLFNKMTPMEDQVLRERLLTLTGRAGAEVDEIFVMDMSKRTSRDNAFFTGLGKTKRIVVGDNMLELGHDAVEVVVAHETGHWRRHGMIKRIVALTVGAPLFFGVVALIVRADPLQRWAGVTSERDPAALPLFILAAGVVTAGTRWLSRWRSRWREREADLDALELTGNLEAYRSLWMQMPERNLPDLDPSLWARLRATHPPAFERLAFADVWEAARRQPVPSTAPDDPSPR